MNKEQFDAALKQCLNTPPIRKYYKKPKIRIISRCNGVIRMCFLVKGSILDGYKAAEVQSHNKKHKHLILLQSE